MFSQEVCLLRWELLDTKILGFILHSVQSTSQWVAYLERKNPSNVILRSPEIITTYSVLISSNQKQAMLQEDKARSYVKILNELLKQNWKPAAFDIDGMATTFLRDI